MVRQPVLPAATYTVAMGSFTATGGEGYSMLERARVELSETPVADVFVQAFERAGELSPPPLGRLTNFGRLATVEN